MSAGEALWRLAASATFLAATVVLVGPEMAAGAFLAACARRVLDR